MWWLLFHCLVILVCCIGLMLFHSLIHVRICSIGILILGSAEKLVSLDLRKDHLITVVEHDPCDDNPVAAAMFLLHSCMCDGAAPLTVCPYDCALATPVLAIARTLEFIFAR